MAHPEVGSQQPSHLVVIGSSAGGIEALSTLVSSLPADFAVPIIIAQHLDPRHPSRLVEILSRYSPLPVRSIAGLEPLRAGTVYVIPSDQQIEIVDGTAHLEPCDEQGPRPSVNRLFSNAAVVFREHLIAIVLSGTGSDGAAGARMVHEEGGTVIIQNPETAAFPGMPRSLAVETVDVVANLEDIGSLLQRLLTEPDLLKTRTNQQTLQQILDLVRRHRGIDFNEYRQPTIMRRLQRRMVATNCTTMSDYLNYVRTNPDEETHLVRSFLIKVTDFFRDGKTFAYLREHVLPDLIRNAKDQPEGLRIWSAGCATGEEAYSIAILVLELLREDHRDIPVRIFATDLDSTAVGFARRGVYPSTALKNLPSELAARYFQKVDGEYEITEEARKLIVFGPHDLVQTPPFPRIDLLLCRNVLMYLTPDLQDIALHTLAFALRKGGYLVLGTAETSTPLAECFTTDSSTLKVFKRTGYQVPFHSNRIASFTARLPAPARLAERSRPLLATGPTRTASQPRRPNGGSETLLNGLPTGVVSVDEHYDIQFINIAAREMLGIYGVAVGEDLIHRLTSVNTADLRAVIDATFKESQPARIEEIVQTEAGTGQERYLQIICAPRRTEPSDDRAPQVIIILNDVTDIVRRRRVIEQSLATQQAEVHSAVTRMQKMGETNRRLLEANEELTIATEQLRALKDEYALASSDAEAATEELEAYAEELQASAEELETLNEELKTSVEELAATNATLEIRAQELSEQRQISEERRSQLDSVLASMGDAVVVVDAAGNSVRTNAAYDEMLASAAGPFIPRDEEGLPLPDAFTPQMRAARGESFFLPFTITGSDGRLRWFEASGRSLSGQTHGVGVVVIRDISERSLRHLLDDFVERSGHELRTPLTAIRGYLQLLIRQLRTESPDERLTRFTLAAIDQEQRLETLVNQLMDVTRIQSNQLELHHEPLDLVALVSGVVEVAQVLAQGQSIDIRMDVDSLLITGDVLRLEGALYNLLTNAIKYAPATERIEVHLGRSDDGAEIAVRDYGPGIPAHDLPYIFSRFYRVAGTNQKGTSGLGLGLYIAREVVIAHGGTIRATSKVGEGTTFTIHLPLRQQLGRDHESLARITLDNTPETRASACPDWINRDSIPSG